MMQYQSNSPQETQEIARKIAKTLKKGDCVTLNGDLGAGKTCFSKGLVSEWANIEVESVLSPTFALCQEYQSAENAELMLYHYDLYRLEDEMELEELGLEEHLAQGVTLIEWPEIAEEWLPKRRIEVHIASQGEGEARVIEVVLD